MTHSSYAHSNRTLERRKRSKTSAYLYTRACSVILLLLSYIYSRRSSLQFFRAKSFEIGHGNGHEEEQMMSYESVFFFLRKMYKRCVYYGLMILRYK